MQGGPFNIHKKNQEVYLTVGIYGIHVLGGWYVSVNDFSMVFKKKNSDIIIQPKKTIWRIQSYELKQPAKKIMVLDVPYSADYIIEFINPKSLKVKRSNLFIITMFEKELPNENLEICIT